MCACMYSLIHYYPLIAKNKEETKCTSPCELLPEWYVPSLHASPVNLFLSMLSLGHYLGMPGQVSTVSEHACLKESEQMILDSW